MENPIIDKLSRSFNVELPFLESMDEYLDFIIPHIRGWGEDLHENKYYKKKPWAEIRDDESFHDSIVHFFNDEGEYLKSVNGDIIKGNWRFLESANKLIIEEKEDDEEVISSELFDLAFLNSQFFILRKHGNQKRLGRSKYFVLAFEPIAKKLEWRDTMELLFNQYRSNNNLYVVIAVILGIIIAIILMLSVF
ncbi:MAG: hypothetical protein GY705_03950 [Bacteroidetes bacterium]|nr:hypothetical protein [Bacteroidota bacterium]